VDFIGAERRAVLGIAAQGDGVPGWDSVLAGVFQMDFNGLPVFARLCVKADDSVVVGVQLHAPALELVVVQKAHGLGMRLDG
jgi:hypothetical protein